MYQLDDEVHNGVTSYKELYDKLYQMLFLNLEKKIAVNWFLLILSYVDVTVLRMA